MDKKKNFKDLTPDDVRGFEEFIEGQPTDPNAHSRGGGGSALRKNDTGFENLTYLSNDGVRLTKLKDLLSSKLPFSARFDQGAQIIQQELEEVSILRMKLFEQLDRPGSPYRRSLAEVFDTFFEPVRRD